MRRALLVFLLALVFGASSAGVSLSPWYWIPWGLALTGWVAAMIPAHRRHKRERHEQLKKIQADYEETVAALKSRYAAQGAALSGYASGGLISPLYGYGYPGTLTRPSLYPPATEAPNGPDRRTPARVRSASPNPAYNTDTGEGDTGTDQDTCASLIGYRRWKVNGSGLLTGISVEDIWIWGANTSVCRRSRFYPGYTGYEEFHSPVPSHTTPIIGCECGYWAHSTPPLGLKDGSQFVWGAVELWGAVVEHEHGWRAEHARVVALVGHDDLAARYQAASFSSMDALVSEFPPTRLDPS